MKRPLRDGYGEMTGVGLGMGDQSPLAEKVVGDQSLSPEEDDGWSL